MRRWTLGVMLAAGLWLPAVAVARPVVYVTNQASATVSVFHATADGSLVPVGAPLPSGGADPVAIALTPDGRRAYVANEGPDTVTAFAVAEDGALASVGAPVASGGADPSAVAVSPDGRFVFVANRTANSVRSFAIQGDGTLVPTGPAAATGGTQARSVITSPEGARIYVGSSTTANVRTYTVAGDGALTAVGPPVAVGGADTFDLVAHPDGTRLFGANFGTNDVPELAVGADGVPAPTGVRPSSNGTFTRSAALAPDGRHVFVANNGEATLQAFQTAGGLTAAGGPVATGAAGPYGMAVAPGSRFLYIAQQSGSVAAFAVGSDGVPAPVAAPLATGGAGPRGLAVRPDQGPTALVTATSGPVAQFDASASSDDGAIVRYDWDFGDGSGVADGGPAPLHAYGDPGTYVATVTVTDDAGCSAHVVTTGRTVSCNGGPAARASVPVLVPPDTTAPRITQVRLARRLRARARATLRFTLSEPARVVVRGGLRRVRRTLPAGRVRVRFRAPRRTGRRRLAIVARDLAGNRARRKLSFRSLPAKRARTAPRPR